jgi:protein-tyrosine phosphatase
MMQERGAAISTTLTRVLIVCTANAIRSPFLEYLLRARLSETGLTPPVIESAGSAARPGRAAEPRIVEIGRAHGLDIDTHRTRRLDEHVLASAVTVLCAASMHRRTVLDMRPDLLDTTFTVREFARLLSEQTDPVGGCGDWGALARAAARHRSRPRRGVRGDDDLVDPIAQPAEVWDEFERNAVEAVDGIVHHAVRLLGPNVSAPGIGRPPRTRREWRAARALLDSPPTEH